MLGAQRHDGLSHPGPTTLWLPQAWGSPFSANEASGRRPLLWWTSHEPSFGGGPRGDATLEM